MIFDTLSHAALYETVHPKFAAAFAFLKEHSGDDLPVGRYEICDGVFAMSQKVNLLPADQGKWEAHEKYIDIQYVQTGAEGIGVTQTDTLSITVPYDPEKDICFGTGTGSICHVGAGEYLILWPHDAHMPMLQFCEEISSVSKIVVKVRV